MANVLRVEGWGLCGEITNDSSATAPERLTALGWAVSRGSAASGKALLSVAADGPLTLVSANTTSGAGINVFANLPNTPDTIVAGWSTDDTWVVSGFSGPGIAFHTAPLVDRSPQTPQFSVYVIVKRLSDGSIQLIANNTTAGETSPSVASGFIPGVDNWVELSITRSTGIAELWINNALALTWTVPYSLTGLDFSALAAAITNSTNIPGFNGTIVMGDAYVADERLGRCQVITRRPTVDVETGFSRTQGDSNASQVADANGSDGDATYVRSVQTGDQDRYDSSDPIGLTNERIHAVAVTAIGRREEVGVRSITPIVERGGAVEAGTAIPLSVSPYRGGQSVFDVDPSTGATWTLTGVEEHTFGMRLTE